MAQATIIDGKAKAAQLSEDISARTATLIEQSGVQPGLAVVIVGEDPASQVYVRNKKRRAESCGFHSVQHSRKLRDFVFFSAFTWAGVAVWTFHR